MSLANLADLRTAVTDWANRGDTSVGARVDDFIRLGEVRIWRVVRSMWGLSDPTTLTVPTNSNFVALPADWLGFDSIGTTLYPELTYMDYAGLSRLPTPGRGDRFSVRGPNLFFGQTVQVAQPIVCTYFKHPGYLSTVNTTWLLTRAPDLYLYAALIEAALYVKKSDKVGEWGALFDKAVVAYMQAERGDLIRGQHMRMRRG